MAEFLGLDPNGTYEITPDKDTGELVMQKTFYLVPPEGKLKVQPIGEMVAQKRAEPPPPVCWTHVFVDGSVVAGGTYLDVPKEESDQYGIMEWCRSYLGLPRTEMYELMRNVMTGELNVRKVAVWKEEAGPDSCIDVLISTTGEQKHFPIPNKLGCPANKVIEYLGEDPEKYMLIDVGSTMQARITFPLVGKQYMLVEVPGWLQVKKNKTD